MFEKKKCFKNAIISMCAKHAPSIALLPDRRIMLNVMNRFVKKNNNNAFTE